MSKKSDNLIKNKKINEIIKIEGEIDKLAEEISPFMMNRLDQAEGQVLFFYGIGLGLSLNLIANVISNFFEYVTTPIYFIYVVTTGIVTIYIIYKAFNFFQKTYVAPTRKLLEMLKKLETHKETLVEYKKILKK